MGVCTKSSYFVPSDTVSVSPGVFRREIQLVSDPSAILGRFQVRFVVKKVVRTEGGYAAFAYYTKVYEISAKHYQHLVGNLTHERYHYRQALHGGEVYTVDRTCKKKRDT